MKQLILYIFSLLNYIYPKSKNKIIFISSPDFSDNSFALFKHMIENTKKKKNYTWLVDNIKDKELYLDMIDKNISFTHEALKQIQIIDKKSFSGMWIFISTKYIFFTHGFYTGMSLPKQQVRINLWHGMPLKAIGYLNKHGNDATIPKPSIVLATSELYQDIMGKVFKVAKEKILITGQPRCDLFWETQDILKRFGIEKNKYQKVILWTPTYRYDKNYKIKDGIFNDTLPLLKEDDLIKLNSFLASIKSYMVIKLHPMDILNTYSFDNFSNIKILKDNVFLHEGCQLYSLLSEIDILITDFSSIYIDFLLLDRPIIFAIDDFDEYTKTRDFVFQSPKDYMPGSLVDSTQSLIAILNDIIINDNDLYTDKRKKIKKEFHKYENSFSERLIKSLKL